MHLVFKEADWICPPVQHYFDWCHVEEVERCGLFEVLVCAAAQSVVLVGQNCFFFATSIGQDQDQAIVTRNSERSHDKPVSSHSKPPLSRQAKVRMDFSCFEHHSLSGPFLICRLFFQTLVTSR